MALAVKACRLLIEWLFYVSNTAYTTYKLLSLSNIPSQPKIMKSLKSVISTDFVDDSAITT